MSGAERSIAMSARSRRPLHPALAVMAIVTIGAVILVGTLGLEIGPVILKFGSGHGIHLGDLVLMSALLPVALRLGWRLAARAGPNGQ